MLDCLSTPSQFGRFQIWAAVPPPFGFGEIAFLGFPLWQFPHSAGGVGGWLARWQADGSRRVGGGRQAWRAARGRGIKPVQIKKFIFNSCCKITAFRSKFPNKGELLPFFVLFVILQCAQSNFLNTSVVRNIPDTCTLVKSSCRPPALRTRIESPLIQTADAITIEGFSTDLSMMATTKRHNQLTNEGRKTLVISLMSLMFSVVPN
ncbi:hypothetical protein DSO57_1037593 [Entomophthora muscae]|uniref:Uncharacterized protein n=1 Tax=Entomophthora muscae TaxID=34485 RepID=A0ACC2UJI1_9FUNG|nr:hypothetical protein DSO57_1037593 [Entomophthora muscae]